MATVVKVIIPFEEFERIFAALPRRRTCANVWCVYSRTTCHVRELREEIRAWWKQANGSAPGFACYERVLQNAIKHENKLYWCFWTNEMKPCKETFDELTAQVKLAFAGKPIDTNRSWY